MKLKSIYMTLGLACVLGASSCSDFLELNPKTSLTDENYYSSPADAYRSLMGVYEKLRTDYAGTYEDPGTYIPVNVCSGVMSDDMYTGGGAATDMAFWQDMARFTSDPSTNTVGKELWEKCFIGIQRANTLIANYKSIPFKESEADIKAYYLAETRFLRAHYYFELARFFENVPMPETAYEGENWRDATQATPEELYQFIAAEMLAASSQMAEQAPEIGRLSKYAAMAELTKVYAFYTGYYQKTELPLRVLEDNSNKATFTLGDALAMAKNIIDNSGAVLEADYETLFTLEGENSLESLFEIPFAGTGSGYWGEHSYGNILCQLAGPRGYSNATLEAGWGFAIPTHSLYNAFEAGDSRLKATIMTAKDLIDQQVTEGNAPSIEAGFTHTGLFNAKFTTKKEFYYEINPMLNWMQNYHYIRLADIILLAAEFELANGNNAGATAYVNQIRTRAGLGELGSVTLDDIYQERRVELAFEGHRYFDLIRRGLDYAKAKIDITNYTLQAPMATEDIYVIGGKNMTGDLGNAPEFEVNFDMNKKGFLPIPQYDIDLNKNLKQNAGY